MSGDDWGRVEELFQAAVALPEERRAVLLAAAEPGLRSEVERLLAADARAEGFFEAAVEAGARAVTAAVDDRWLGRRIGVWRLVRRLGRGGMSSVYLGERADGQFDQLAAVKLVRRGMGSEDIVERLRAERRILAGLDHPNIARLYDGGSTEDGLPYFIMEHVDGLPIDAYCDARGLDLRGRLRLFCDVCSAVHYAHRNLVVHRDLKPSNVLVTADGTPKLLDFGIAKLLKPEEVDAAGQATVGERLMTPGYASPEQVRGGAITTASDVYSLGVLLYELLTGRRPQPVDGRSSPQEVERVICEERPDKPSTAVVRATRPAGEPAPEVAGRRRGERPETLARRLRGDLDTIVLMALRKEPERRYGSVEQLSEDLRRYLRGHPVIARQDTFGYRAAKFVGRHRLEVAAAVAAALLVLGFGIAMAVQSARTARERDRAERTTAALVDLFELAGSGHARGDTISARALLERGEEQVRQLDGQPATQVKLTDALGEVYENLGLFDEAERMYDRSLGLAGELHGERHPAVATRLYLLGRAVARGGDYRRAEGLFRRSLELRRRLLGPDRQEVAESLNALALALHEMGDYERAEPLYREALALDLRLVGERHDHTVITLANLGLLLHDKGAYREAEEVFRRALQATGDGFGAGRGGEPGVAVPAGSSAPTELPEPAVEFLDGLGQALQAQGELGAAEDVLSRALERRRELFGDEHPLTARSLSHLGDLLRERGELAAAEPLLRSALEQRRRLLGEENAEVAESLLALAALSRAAGETAAAEVDLRRSLAIYRRALGDEHPFTGRALAALGTLLAAGGRCGEAEPLLTGALALLPPRDRRLPAVQRARDGCDS